MIKNKGDKTRDKGRQKGDKPDTVTNKKGDKGRQAVSAAGFAGLRPVKLSRTTYFFDFSRRLEKGNQNISEVSPMAPVAGGRRGGLPPLFCY